MIFLTIGNSYCQLTGLSDSQFRRVRELLSYQEKIYGVSGHRSLTRHLMSKRGEFPSGLLSIVQAQLSGYPGYYDIIDLRMRPQPHHGLFTLSLSHQPYPEQIEAVEAAMRLGRASISMPTGSGKSVAMALLIQASQVRTLVVVPNLSLKEQLKASFTTWFGSQGMQNITIENVDSPALKTANDYNMLIIDEAHHVASRTYHTLNRKAWGSIYHRYFFSATHFRSQDHELLLMQSISGNVAYTLSYQTAVARGMIVPLEAYYVEVPTQAYDGPESWAAVYSALVVNNEARNQIIVNMIESLKGDGVPTLTLVKEIKHGEALSARTGIGFANGQDGSSRMRILEFILGETVSLVGTVGVVGEGQDTKPAEYVLMAGGGKAKTQFMQNCGRALRTSPGKESGKIIIFLDKSHRWLRQHFNAQRKILLDEYNVKVIRLDI